MDGSEYGLTRYDGAVQLLPYPLRSAARSLPGGDRAVAEELRLRAGRPMTALLPDGEVTLGGGAVTRNDIETLVEIATGASVHTSREQLRRGFLVVRGGYRIGLCGSVYSVDGRVAGFSSYSSAAIRVSRQMPGIAKRIMPGLTRGGAFRSCLIIAPPGAGKTTLLRDVIVQLSDVTGLRVALADERSEVAAMAGGDAQMDVGRRTDVLDACPKAEAVMMLLRSMNPQVVALDEITDPADIRAIGVCRNCGVSLLATAHGSGIADLRLRPLYRDLFEDGVFETFVIIRMERGRRVYDVIRGEDL